MSRIIQPSAAWPQTLGPDPAQFIAAGLAKMPMAQGVPFQAFRSSSQRDHQAPAPKVMSPVHVVVRTQSSPHQSQAAPRAQSVEVHKVPPSGAAAIMQRTGSQSIPFGNQAYAHSPSPKARVTLSARVVSGGLPYGTPAAAQARGRSPPTKEAEAPARRQEVTFEIQEPVQDTEVLSPVCSISTLQSFCIDESTKVLDETQVVERVAVPLAAPQTVPQEANPREALIAELALKLEDLDTTSTEDLQRVVMSSLITHGFKATAAILEEESDSAIFENASPKATRGPVGILEPLVPPGMPMKVVNQFRDAGKLHDRYHKFVVQSSEEVVEHQTRLEKLIGRVHSLRELVGLPEQEKEAMQRLKQQDDRLEELKLSSDAFDNAAQTLTSDIERKLEEKVVILNAIEAKTDNAQLYLSQAPRATKSLEELKKKAERSEAAQAQRVRHLLLKWDTAQGPKRLASETFAKVDANHDGRLEYDEVLKLARLIFQHYHIDVPVWPDAVWAELFRSCQLDQAHAIDVTESLKFTRGCFEAALRSSAGG